MVGNVLRCPVEVVENPLVSIADPVWAARPTTAVKRALESSDDALHFVGLRLGRLPRRSAGRKWIA